MVESRIAGVFEVLRIEALRALYPRLGLRLGVTLRELLKESLRGTGQVLKDSDLVALDGELCLQDDGHQPSACFISSGSSAHRRMSGPTWRLIMACDLDAPRLEVIERAREERPPVFWVHLWPTLVMREEQPMPTCRVVWEATRSELGDALGSTKLRALLTDRVGKVRADTYTYTILSQTEDLAAAQGRLHGACAPSKRTEAQVLLACTASLLALVTELAPVALRATEPVVADSP